MKKTKSLNDFTFGEFATQTIEKNFQKSVKYEAEVLKDEDPEALHEMRVGMRRLRTVLQVFAPALDLPKCVDDQRIGKIARCLGAVRDLDVLKEALLNRYRSQLQGKERKRFEMIGKNLQKQRIEDFDQLKQMLNSSLYEKFKSSFSEWLVAPTYKAIAYLPIREVLPDLMLPLIGEMFLHPGWFVGVTASNGQRKNTPVITADNGIECLEQQSELLHDLRKQMKRVRYQTEFFVDFYNSEYQAQIQAFKNVQEILGGMQDSWVLREFLVVQLEADLSQVMPTVAQQLQAERLQLWQEWQPVRQQYLNPEFRQTLRQQVMIPVH